MQSPLPCIFKKNCNPVAEGGNKVSHGAVGSHLYCTKPTEWCALIDVVPKKNRSYLMKLFSWHHILGFVTQVNGNYHTNSFGGACL